MKSHALHHVAAIHLGCYQSEQIGSDAELGRHIADEWTQACTITTVEQLDELPEQSVVRNLAFGVVLECTVDNAGVVGWISIGDPSVRPSVVLPALLIWHPGWSDQ